MWAAAVFAFTPKIGEIAGYFNYDSMAIALAALAMWTALRAHRTNWSARWAIALGLTLGAIGLTRYSAYFAALPALALVVHGWWTGGWRRAPVAPLLIAATALAVWGWWPVRNLILYGEPTGIATIYAELVPGDTTLEGILGIPNTVPNLLTKTPFISDTWRGVWGSRAEAAAGPWVWMITAGLCVVLFPWRRRERAYESSVPLRLLVLAFLAAVALNLVGLVNMSLTYNYTIQGRYLLGLAPLGAALLAVRVSRLPDSPRRAALAFGLLLMAAFLLAYVTGYFVPAAILFFV